MPQNLWPTRFVKLIAPTVAVAEESGGPALEVVLTQLLPLRGVLEPDRELGVFMANEVLPRVPAIHAYQPIEHRFEIAARAVPVYRPDDGPGVRQIEAGVQVEVPHQVGLPPASLFVAVTWPDAQRHRSRDARIAGPDLFSVPYVSQILEIDLPFLRQTVPHAEHQGAGLGVDARAVVLAPV